MTLFSDDLYRNFGIGFAVGAMIVGVSTIDQWGPELESAAQAAPMIETSQALEPAAEFVIEPLPSAQ